MRKKVFNCILLSGLLFVLTGCVKFNANMDIRKDKSMDFNIIYAVDTQYFGDMELLEEVDKKELQEDGFTVKNYSDGTMKGVTISREVKNIDVVSTTEDTEYSLSSLFEEAKKDEYLFKVKKGLFKNVYIANLTFDSSDSDLSTDSDDSLEEEESSNDSVVPANNSETDNGEVTIDEDTTLDESTSSEDDMDFSGLESMMGSLDMSFNVTLPYAAISNNATEVSNEGKTLKWVLTTEDVASMKFEFELYNMPIIYGGIAVLAVIVLVVVFIVIKKFGKKNNKTKNEMNTSSEVSTASVDTNNMINQPTGVNNIGQMSEPVVGVNNNIQGNMSTGMQDDMNNQLERAYNSMMQMNNSIPNMNNTNVVQNNNVASVNMQNGMMGQAMPQVNNNMVQNNVSNNNGMVMQNNVMEPVNNPVNNNVSSVNMQNGMMGQAMPQVNNPVNNNVSDLNGVVPPMYNNGGDNNFPTGQGMN